MKISPSFKKAIRKTFYDKEFVLYKTVKTRDEEGDVTESLQSLGSFEGSIQFGNLDAIKEEYGFREDVEAVIKCDNAESVSLDNVVGYESMTLRVVQMIPNDSHNLIGVRKWLSGSEDLTSL